MRGGLSDDDTSFSSPVGNLTKWSLLPFVLFLFLSPIFANWARTFRGACFPFYQRKIKEKNIIRSIFRDGFDFTSGKNRHKVSCQKQRNRVRMHIKSESPPSILRIFPRFVLFWRNTRTRAYVQSPVTLHFFQDRTTLITPRVDSKQKKISPSSRWSGGVEKYVLPIVDLVG